MTNLYGNERFDVYCENAAWVGSGRYKATNDRITLTFDLLSRRDQVVKHPAPLDMTFEGKGNELVLKWRDADLVWKRHL